MSGLLIGVGDLGCGGLEGDDDEEGADSGQGSIASQDTDDDHASDDIKCGMDADRVHVDVVVVVVHVGSVDNAAVDDVRERGRSSRRHDLE